MPNVSIIIPVFNRAALLAETLESVIAQTHRDWECVVVDDGSTESLDFVRRVDDRVRLIRQASTGVSVARNRGIVNSAGELVAFIDSDDLWLPHQLESLVSALKGNPQAGMCYSTHGVILPSGERVMGRPEVRPRLTYADMLTRGVPLTSTLMVRRSCLGLVGIFDPTMPISEDTDLLLRIAYQFPVAYTPECGVLYRIHSGNSSRNFRNVYRTLMNLAEKHRIAAVARGQRENIAAAGQMAGFWRGHLGVQAFDAARESLRTRQYRRFLADLARAFAWAPGYTARCTLGWPLARRRPRRT
ncbi:MAG: glycosyltransferase family 2 protein, partial [Phycisphaerae bacterium]